MNMTILPEIIIYAAAGVGAAVAFGQTQLNAWYDELTGGDDNDEGDGPPPVEAE